MLTCRRCHLKLSMFFRIKPAGERRYLQIVENKRNGRTVQRVLATLGRIEDLEADGRLDTLLRSGARFCETAMLISTLRAGTLEGAGSLRIGPPMVFGRLWEQAGCRAVIEQLAAGRNFGFALERAIFVSVLHRLMVSGSDRACEKWLDGYQIDGADGLELHQLYRAMAWLGEELADQSGATRAPRRIKDLIEEALFQRRRSLFSDLSVVLFDTTSLMFYGAGGESLGQRGKSKDHRPDLKQVVVGVVLDEAGRPICSETWPGNAADVKALLPVVRRLRERFGIARMCVVADRGMISAETINELETHGVEYILGARERNSVEVRKVVLADEKPMIPLVIPRTRGAETALEVKEVVVGDWGPGCHPRRYVVCFNPEEASRDAALREAILDSLRTKLQQGDKGLVGNAGYRRFLAAPKNGHFEIDPARVTEDARFDGIYVLRTNSKLPVLSVALAYRQLWKVEAIFRTAKSILETRPIYHQSDAAVAGHLFCSFLAPAAAQGAG
jgi:Transposase DDE domain